MSSAKKNPAAPFVKKFRTKKYSYIYDVNSNEIIKVNPVIYDIIEETGDINVDVIVKKFKHKYKPDDIIENFNQIKKVKAELSLFSNHRPEISSGIYSKEDIKPVLDSNLRQIILELTARCNQRCKYCSFSGRYSYNRSHEKKDMTITTAKKAINFFIDRCNGDNEEIKPAITFYGGEPLLRFDLIKDIVKMVKSKEMFKKSFFSFTTNGTLLTGEIIDYLVENEISLLISLDGPKAIHDKYRVFPDGSGTFDKVLKNLEQIKRSSPNYFENKISFNAVISPPYNFDVIIAFFYENEFFSSIRGKVTLNYVDSFETTFFKDFQLEKEKGKLRDEIKKMIERYKNSLIDNEYEKLTIEKNLFFEAFFNIEKRVKGQTGKFCPPLGKCLPGQRRLFVDTGGEFYMCERVGSNYKIGDVDMGFDFRKILDFHKKYDEFYKKCKYCWALRLCKKCFNDVNRGAEFDEVRRNKMCNNILSNIKTYLQTYCEIKEENPDAFDIFKEVKLI
jgi:uncharacterized protein